MALGTEWGCPHTGEWCQNASCPATACLYDLDEAVWPDTEADERSAANVEVER